jgi:hypothetical protein
MNLRVARRILRGYRPDDQHDRETRRALELARRTPALDAGLRGQIAFDDALEEKLSVELPAELAAALAEPATQIEAIRPRRFSFRDPAALAVGCAFLALIALLAWIFFQSGSLSGMSEVVELAKQGDNARPEQFDEFEATADTLADWFAMKEFDGFVLPPGMESAPVVGVRLDKYEDVPVAVAAIAKPRAFFYVFAAQPLGLSIPDGRWEIKEYDRHVLAVTQLGNTAFVVSMRGDAAAMRKYLGSLPAAAR